MHTIAHSLSVCVVVVNRANTAQSNCNVQYLGRIKRKKEANNVFYITIIERVQFEMLCQIKVPRRERLNLSKQSKKNTIQFCLILFHMLTPFLTHIS